MKNISKSAYKYNEKDPYIACVGENGGTTYMGMLQGFYDATQILYGNLKISTIDIIVYPLCFCMRHCIELGLKIILIYIKEMKCASIRIDPKTLSKIDSVLGTHSIKDLYNMLKQLIVVDKRLKKVVREINYNHKLFEFYFDKKGDAFRYPVPRGNGKNVFIANRIMQIALTDLWNDFSGIYEKINQGIETVELLYLEYNLGVFTRTLSRSDIFFIANKLKDFKNWNDKSFVKCKTNIINKYKISNKEFSAAINIIKNHIYLSTLIGKEVKFINFSTNALNIYSSYFFKVNSKNKTGIPSISEEDVHGLSSKLPKKDVKLLYLFYMYGKEIDTFVEFANNEYSNLKSDNHTVEDYARKILYPRSLEAVKFGMSRLGQITYLNELNENCERFKKMTVNYLFNNNYENTYI